MEIASLPLWLTPEWVLMLFTNSQELIELGKLPVQTSGLNIVLEVTAIVITQALLGAGVSQYVVRIDLSFH